MKMEKQRYSFDARRAVELAGTIGGFLNDEKLSGAEALLRLIAGVSWANVAADPDEIDAEAQLPFETQHEVGAINDVAYGIFKQAANNPAVMDAAA